MKPKHIPVLLNEVLDFLSPQPGERFLDGTAGLGGHSAAIIERIGDSGRAVLVDRDQTAIDALEAKFGDRAELRQLSYLEAARDLADEEVKFDMILLDLGVSSPQLDNSERGFSFKTEAQLDMRMDQTQSKTAAVVVNEYRPEDLERVIRDYGEEPRARAVARVIVEARPLATTIELAKVVRGAAAFTRGTDVATRTFQGIRIEVNDELRQLSEALPILEGLLEPGGRMVVISFHSLEDRIVKEFMDKQSRGCVCPPKQPICTCEHEVSLHKLTRKVVTGTADEIALNPRARSAKLRAAEKIKTKGGTKNVRQSPG